MDAALSPRMGGGGSNNGLTSNNDGRIMTNNNDNGGSDDSCAADAASTSGTSRRDEIPRSPTDNTYVDDDYGGNGSNDYNIDSSSSSTNHLSSPLFGSVASCIPNAARAIASMLTGTVARVTNYDHDVESSATAAAAAAAAKVVSEVMYATTILLPPGDDVDDYGDHRHITAAVSDITNAASSSSNSNNHSNDAIVDDHSSSNCGYLPHNNNDNDSSSSPISRVVVSLEDEHYKEIMWKHFRILGKSRDIELSKIGHEILVEFKQQMSSSNGGRFYRRERGQEIEIDDDKALCSEYTLPILSITVAFQMFSDRHNSCAFLLFQLVYYLYNIIQRLTLTLADE